MVTIVTGTTNKPTASEAVKQFFQTHSEIDGYLYIGYPIIGTVDGAYPSDIERNEPLCIVAGSE